MERISVLGAGSWGTALARLLCNNGHDVTMWSALPEEIRALNAHGENCEKLSGVKLPSSMRFTDDLKEAVSDRDILLLAVPSGFVRSTAAKLSGLIPDGQIIVNVAKGIEESTLKTLSEVIEDELPTANVVVLSGPSHAEEVGRDIPTSIVAGAHRKTMADYIQNTFMSESFRVYTSPDLLGIELGAALKNVVALAAGIADGLGYGDNTKAALITRGMAEITKLGVEMGGRAETFAGLSGIGDLIVTCGSMHSRNRRAGILIGQGHTYEEAMAEVKQVVEGVYSAKAALKLAHKYHVELPICEQVNAVLFEGKDAGEAVRELMLRDKKIENNDMLWRT